MNNYIMVLASYCFGSCIYGYERDNVVLSLWRWTGWIVQQPALSRVFPDFRDPNTGIMRRQLEHPLQAVDIWHMNNAAHCEINEFLAVSLKNFAFHSLVVHIRRTLVLCFPQWNSVIQACCVTYPTQGPTLKQFCRVAAILSQLHVLHTDRLVWQANWMSRRVPTRFE
jgi:hypothetical protein